VALISVSQGSLGTEKATINVGSNGPIDAICVNADLMKIAVA